MSNQKTKYKLGTADTLLLAVGTLAIDYICTSKTEIVEVQPGGKKVYSTIEQIEEKIKRYGIKKGQVFPGSSLGNFINQAQELTRLDPKYAPVHLVTTLAPNDPSTQLLTDSLDKKGTHYEITEFIEENAANPIALLVEANGYTKILSFKDKRMPAIKVHDPKEGKPGLVMIGAVAGNAMESKRNALHYAKDHNLPIGVITTEGEIDELAKDNAFKRLFREILGEASFLAINEDEARKIIPTENPTIKLSRDRVTLAQQLREVFANTNLDILLSYGSEGSLALIGNTAYIQKVPKVPYKNIVSTAGAGDTLAGAFVQGVRIKGMDAEGVRWSLARANRAAQNILKYPDTTTGQFTAQQFLEEPPAEYETDIVQL